MLLQFNFDSYVMPLWRKKKVSSLIFHSRKFERKKLAEIRSSIPNPFTIRNVEHRLHERQTGRFSVTVVTSGDALIDAPLIWL